ncbi:hypothetical protein ACWGXJ_25465 [Paenibacillus sp. S33]
MLYFSTDNWADRGTFGDMFGSVNVLFSGLAFAAVVYTIQLQRQDLELQREVQKIQIQDLKMQAEATKKSAEQLETQQQLLNFQVTQDTVLNLISIKDQLVNDFSWRPDGIKGFVRKRPVLYEELVGIEAVVEYYNDSVKMEQKKPVYKPFFVSYHRIFFYTLQFIDQSNIDNKQKQVLADVLSIKTSDNEFLILYNLNNEQQMRLMLLKKYGFYDRYKEIDNSNKTALNYHQMLILKKTKEEKLILSIIF